MTKAKYKTSRHTSGGVIKALRNCTKNTAARRSALLQRSHSLQRRPSFSSLETLESTVVSVCWCWMYSHHLHMKFYRNTVKASEKPSHP